MCGIGGFICLAEDRPEQEEIIDMWAALTSRGRDASGIALRQTGGDIHIAKNAQTPRDLWKDVAGKIFESVMPDMAIFHTRAATQGTVKNNKNNHPLFDDKAGLVLVHNGMISNDAEVLRGKRRDAEVDSEALVRVMADAKNDWASKVAAVAESAIGSYAVLAMSKHIDGILAMRSSNPLEWGVDMDRKIVFFSSDKKNINDHVAAHRIHGFPMARNIRGTSLSNDSAYVVTKEGLAQTIFFKHKERTYLPAKQLGQSTTTELTAAQSCGMQNIILGTNTSVSRTCLSCKAVFTTQAFVNNSMRCPGCQVSVYFTEPRLHEVYD